jgi:hypothetical protein
VHHLAGSHQLPRLEPGAAVGHHRAPGAQLRHAATAEPRGRPSARPARATPPGPPAWP